MPSINFLSGTIVPKEWLNDVDETVYNILGNAGTPPASAAAVRTNIGLGSMAVQASSAVVITGGSISGVSISSSPPTFSSPLTVDNGGTGLSSLSPYQILFGGTSSTGALQQISTGNSGQFLKSSGPGVLPAFSAISGIYLQTTVKTSGSSFSTGSNTNLLKIRMVAGGGAGGGNALISSNDSASGGGGSGSYAEWTIAVTPNTSYTCSIGAGGVPASGNNPGGNGGNTTFTIGGITVTCNGGIGGTGSAQGAQSSGGAGGAISTNGTFNIPGQNGSGGLAGGFGDKAGDGGSTPLGFGGQGSSNGNGAQSIANAGTGYGSGGSGISAKGSFGASQGGAGAPGVIIIEEYS